MYRPNSLSPCAAAQLNWFFSPYFFQRQQTNTKDIAISHIALLNTAQCDDVDDHNNDDDDEDGDYSNYDDGDYD